MSSRARRAGGQPIGELMHRALARPELISLAAGFVDQATLPAESTLVACQHVLSDPLWAKPALQYGTTAGLPRLRQQLLDRVALLDGHASGFRSRHVDQVLVTAGSNQLLHLICDTLCDPGDIVLSAAPTYFVFLGLLQNLGIEARSVAGDEGGLLPEALDARLAALAAAGELSRVKALYVCSYFDNPSGVTVLPERRPAIVEVLKRWSAKTGPIYLLEDAAYRALRYRGGEVASFLAHDPEGETVIYADTFSKCYAPGVRVGYGIVPPLLVRPLVEQKGNLDFGAPHLSQYIVSDLIDQQALGPHLERLRAAYRAKLEAMLQAADEHLAGYDQTTWVRPDGGLYVWLRLPPGVSAGLEGALFAAALEEGVLYVPGEYAFPRAGDVPMQENTIRLSFGVQSPERIAQGIAALGRALGKTLS